MSKASNIFISHGKEGHFNLERSDEYQKFPKLLEILEDRGLV